jgi:myo-inositol-1(or 4)-monophosphatase
MNDVMEFAINLALETGELLQKYYNFSGIHASTKPDKSVVTEADLAADKLIILKINALYPQDEIVSEESSHFLTDIHLPIWVVDPLDGTTNYSLGLPVWGVSIARLIDGHPDLGVLFFPRLNELYFSQRGSGAFLNHQPISTHAPDPTQPMSFFACCSRTFRGYDISVPYKPRIMGSSAYSYCLVARGSALLGFDATPKIWDLSAVWILVEEAGGSIQSFEGSQIFPIKTEFDYSTTSFPVLAGATSSLLEKAQSMIRKK